VFHLYDTTLRDGAQQEGLRLSVSDKLRIARVLDDLGVGFIEGGWPGANPDRHRLLRRPPRRATCRTEARDAGRVRLDAPGGGTGRRATR
jgi:isopropylmalate/homocitrate/citramalate synthase